MQVAINALLFFLGFGCAVVASTQPKKARSEIERVLSNVNYILDTLRHPTKSKLQASAGANAPIAFDDDEQALFTRYDGHSGLINT